MLEGSRGRCGACILVVKRAGCKPAKWSLSWRQRKGRTSQIFGVQELVRPDHSLGGKGCQLSKPWCLTVKLLVTVVASELGVASGWVRVVLWFIVL